MKTFRYRATVHDPNGTVVLTGKIRTGINADSPGNIRGRIMSDIAYRTEFDWVEIYEEAPRGEAVA